MLFLWDDKNARSAPEYANHSPLTATVFGIPRDSESEYTVPSMSIKYFEDIWMKTAVLLLSLFVVGCTAADSSKDDAQASPATNRSALDAQIESLMAREDVKGLAVAIVQDGTISHVGAYGFRNVANNLPLETDTIMYGASLTKAAFAYMVMQLVDEGKVDLDRPIDELLDKPLPAYPDWASLDGDEEWRLLTPRMLLTHSSGLANLRFLEPDQDLKFHFVPGQSYSYSGEGFYLLQLMLEEGLGLNVKSEMQTRLFDRFGMTRTDMQWREDFADNLADGYAMDGSFEPHDERSNVSASGSMDRPSRTRLNCGERCLPARVCPKRAVRNGHAGSWAFGPPKSFQRSSTTTRSIPGVTLLVFPRASALKPGKARADAILPRAVTTTGPATLCYARKQSNAALSCWRTVFGPKLFSRKLRISSLARPTTPGGGRTRRCMPANRNSR